MRVGTPATTTLGMGVDEMREIAAIFKVVLASTQPTTTKSGEVSRAKYKIDPRAADEARSRIASLLAPFPLYPNLDLQMMLSQYPPVTGHEIAQAQE